MAAPEKKTSSSKLINYAAPKTISNKWEISKREIDRYIMTMARYITEGIIDVID